jgi:hypothetical protein
VSLLPSVVFSFLPSVVLSLVTLFDALVPSVVILVGERHGREQESAAHQGHQPNDEMQSRGKPGSGGLGVGRRDRSIDSHQVVSSGLHGIHRLLLGEIDGLDFDVRVASAFMHRRRELLQFFA